MSFDSWEPSMSQQNYGDGGGGGFPQESTFTSFGSQGRGMSSEGSSPGKRQRTEAQTLAAVTIKQILAAHTTGGKFRIDEKDQSQVTFVGHILDVTNEYTYNIYILEDGSGQIKVSLFSDLENDLKFEPGQYVRVVGNMRLLEGTTSVVGFKLIPVKDYNEITFHMLEVIHSHLLNTKGKPGGSSSSFSSSSQRPTFSSSSHQQQQQQQQQQGGQYGGEFGGGSEGEFTPLQHAILLVFQKEGNQDERGVSTSTICKSLPQHPEPEIKKAIEFLSSEGHLYSTIDEDHFRLTAQ
jgi:replication factor A2